MQIPSRALLQIIFQLHYLFSINFHIKYHNNIQMPGFEANFKHQACMVIKLYKEV